MCACAVASPLVAAQVAAPARPSQLGLCAACHGAQGHASMPGVPNLAGQREDYLRAALRQYRNGQRNVAVMRAAVGPLNDAQLDALAAWYSRQLPLVQGRP
ncbi:MAG: c-type cytochrome [Rhodanobacter sp.]